MNGMNPLEQDDSEFVEVDPTGRYGRYNEILGKGSSKTVYRAFDEFEGIEVAWNQVKLNDFLQSPEDLERLYCEIHLLKTLKHKNIMKFYTSWVDVPNRKINFVTEMFTSGTLRQYRQKHKRVNIRAVKHWCRQILSGLLYLHSLDPPVIHRDLKCDNIFINGNQGEVKIGDLGLAAILRKSHADHCVGTPEFMAPEVYEEEYNELVDIYSFGMCILEMVTFEYPYSECTHPAQIYKKVISGKKPDALYKVKDPEVREFVEKCLAAVSRRLPAKELLKDPFLQIDDYGAGLRPIAQPHFLLNHRNNSLINGSSDEYENGWGYHPVETETNGIELFNYHEDEHSSNVDITIEGKTGEDGGIFLRLRIADKEGRIRNIYFPFDIENDTALSVATEMVAELDITDQDVTKIADMIDGEIASLVPEWKTGLGIEESQELCASSWDNCGSNCISNGTLMDYFPVSDATTTKPPQVQCSLQKCASTHGRFEEVTYQVEESGNCVTEEVPIPPSPSEHMQHTDIWDHREGPGIGSQGSIVSQLDEEHRPFDQVTYPKNDTMIDKNVIDVANHVEPNARNYLSHSPDPPSSPTPSLEYTYLDDYQKEIRQELRWFKVKYHLKSRRSEAKEENLKIPRSNKKKQSRAPCSFAPSPIPGENDEVLLKFFASGKHFSACIPSHIRNSDTRKDNHSEESTRSSSPEHMFTAKSFFSGSLLQQSHRRTASLPAVDV